MLTITHTYVSTVPDGGDPNLVGPDEWNATHQITGTVAASEVTFTPTGGLSAVDVQAALAELDSEKQPLAAALTSWASVTRAAGFDTFATTPSSANLAALVTGETGTGALVFATSPTLVTPNLGTPSLINLANGAGLPLQTGISGLGVNVANFLETPSSGNLQAAVTGETGSGALVFATSPTLVTPVLGTPASGTLTNCTGLPVSGIVNSTTLALGLGSVELGHASDTTLSRLAAGVLGVEGVAVSLGLNGIQQLTAASGTYTPTAGTKSALIIAVGGGGGGGGVGTTAGNGAGGGGGAAETRLYVLTNVTGTYSYACGAGGAGGAAGNNAGGTGDPTTFGTGPLVTANGGNGGGGSTGNGAGANGGTASAGSGGILWTHAQQADNASSSTNQFSRGGSTFLGIGASAGARLTVADNGGGGNAAVGRGAGGGGGIDISTTARAGGNGSSGFITVIEFK